MAAEATAMEEFDVSAFIDVRETMMNIAQAFVTRCCKADVTLSYRTMSPIRSTLLGCDGGCPW